MEAGVPASVPTRRTERTNEAAGVVAGVPTRRTERTNEAAGVAAGVATGVPTGNREVDDLRQISHPRSMVPREA